MQVDYNVDNLTNCSITISGMNSEEFEDMRIILYQLYKYKEGSTKKESFQPR